MLPALCTLFTALSCVSGVTVVTQNPPVLTPTKGETTTMHCNLGTVTNNAARWYKQVPGGVPQFVLYNHQSYSSPTYGSGFSSPKFTSTCSSLSDCNLIISNVEVGDSAVYYCNTRDSSVSEWVSHGVTVVTQNPPDLTATKGETTTMHCNQGTVTDQSARWYKQVPGGVPHSVNYGSGFSSPKFTSTHSSKSDYTLIISNVEVGDSAVYYCKTWDDPASEYVSQ
uniref:Ig-like domain-containing protein n=1 Tax=Astyanax mexicanus TaxID=7994 RepID=A0A3B1K0J4_ASTMX